MNRKLTQNLSNTKSQLRERLLGFRKELTGTEVGEKSGIIGQKLLNTPQVLGIKSVSIYLPIKNEVETKPLIDALTARGADIYLPTYNALSKSYVFSRFNGWDDLKPGPYGILQPSLLSSIIDPSHLDVAIMPGVAFSTGGVRLGYGKGVFDKLLAGSKAIKIGLAYDFQIVEFLPNEAHDLKMDIIVTEERVLCS